MKTFDLEHLTRGLVSLIVVLLPTVGMAQQLTDDMELEKLLYAKRADTVHQRGTQAAPDPWTVRSSSALFRQPTFGEAFKLSAEVTEGEHHYSLSGSIGEALGNPTRFLKGLHTTLAYSTELQQASLSVGWNLSLQEIRFFSDAEKQEVFSAGQADFALCDAAVRAGPPALDIEAFKTELMKCGSAQRDAQDKAFDAVLERRGPRPSFSAAASAAYGFQNNRWGTFTSSVAMKLPVTHTFSFVVNGGFDSSLSEEGLRQPSIGASLAMSWVPDILSNRLRLDVAGKVLECLDHCGPESSTLQFGPSLGIAVDKDSLLGVTLNWSGKGESAGNALLGLAFTRSFGSL